MCAGAVLKDLRLKLASEKASSTSALPHRRPSSPDFLPPCNPLDVSGPASVFSQHSLSVVALRDTPGLEPDQDVDDAAAWAGHCNVDSEEPS